MDIYAEESKWRIIAAAILACVAIAATIIYISQPKPVAIIWDRSQVPPGGTAILYVVVRNTSDFTYKNVAVFVHPLSSYLAVFSDQNVDPHLFIIDTLAPGTEARARFLVKVSKDAYSGDHSLEVGVAFPGKTIVKRTSIRVG